MDNIKKNLYKNIKMDNINDDGIYNIRENGKLVKRKDSEEVKITTKKDNPGINIHVKENTKSASVQIPVIVTQSGLHDMVYNDFYIGANASITILAGCAIHNDCDNDTSHSGIHTFHVGENAKVKYVEKHYGCGSYEKSQINTDTIIYLEENSELVIETVQIGGLSKANRRTFAKINRNANLVINERLMTSSKEKINTYFEVDLDGIDSKCNIVSKSIAKESSKQSFKSIMKGNNKSFGHVECDAILMDKSIVESTPKIVAKTSDANITHEASIGKIAEDEIIKLMTLGLSRKEAENEIIRGFLN